MGAQAIDDTGVVLGYSSTPDGSNGHAALFSGGTTTLLDPVNDGYVMDINASGRANLRFICGVCDEPSPTDARGGFEERSDSAGRDATAKRRSSALR